jgi:hypothetical protein
VSLSDSADYLFSSYRERLIEHLFVGEILRVLWLAGVPQVEVLRSEVDGTGYDVVLECRSITRHVQLKAARLGGTRANVGVNVNLEKKASGCVVWVYFDPETLRLGPFYWFGGSPGEPLPSLNDYNVGKHTKGDASGHKAERPNIRVVPRGEFEKVDTAAELVTLLFGTQEGKA